jgi:hypothetical protein
MVSFQELLSEKSDHSVCQDIDYSWSCISPFWGSFRWNLFQLFSDLLRLPHAGKSSLSSSTATSLAATGFTEHLVTFMEFLFFKKTRQRLLRSSEDSMIEKRNQHYSVDCSHANAGMLCGILILVITIISLIIFFVLISNTDPNMQNIAVQVASISELFLYSLTSFAV